MYVRGSRETDATRMRVSQITIGAYGVCAGRGRGPRGRIGDAIRGRQ
jgi:hypothetical protein